MFCQNCGKEIKDSSKFCKYCGAEVKAKGNSNQSYASSNGSGDDSTKKIIIVALIAVVVVLAVILGIFGMGLLDNNGGDNSVPVADNSNSASVENKAPVSLSSFPVSRAPELAQVVKDSNGVFPVSFESLSLSKAQCLYILTKSIYEIGSGHPDATINVGNPQYAANPSGRDSSQSIARANYVDMCNRFSNWIESQGSVPNYVGIYSGGVADVSPSRMLDISVNVLLQYESTGNLPASIKI